MNYTKKGIHEKQKSLHATSTRLLKKGLLAVLNLFLIAVLAARFQKYDVASRMVATILTSPSANARTKDKARELKDQILEELKSQKK